MKKRIKLTENDLHELVKNIAQKVIKEDIENNGNLEEGFWGNVGNAVKTGYNNRGNMPGDNLGAAWDKFKKLQGNDRDIKNYGQNYETNGFGKMKKIQATMQQLKQEIQQKNDEYIQLQQELVSMNGQNSRNMAGLKRGMGGERYNTARDAYKGGVDANQYDKQYGGE